MDSKEKETKCEKNSGVHYSFPISEYAKQLDLPVRDRYLQKRAAIGIDPVSKGRTLSRTACLLLNPQIFSVILSWRQVSTLSNSSKLSEVLKHINKWSLVLLPVYKAKSSPTNFLFQQR